MEKLENHPVFICGHPKAGTSLVKTLLDGHPALVVYPEETLFFRRFLPAAEGKSFAEQVELAEKLLIHIFEWNQENPPVHQENFPDRDYSDIPFESVKKELADLLGEGNPKVRDFLPAAVCAFGRVSGVLNEGSQAWVEKSPYNEFYADRIFQWWPEARCIHIVRDPRDNYVSYKRKQPGWTVRVFARNWLCSTQAGLANRERYGNDRYRLIRFEDLLTKPEEVTHEITRFLDISWDEALLQPTRAGDAWRGNSMFDETFQDISTDPIDRWKGLLGPYPLAVVQIVCGKTMVQLRYDIVKPDLSALTLKQRVVLLRERFKAKIKTSRSINN
jgi:hypothetical protein